MRLCEMGGLHSSYLSAGHRRKLSERTAAIMRDFSSHFRRQLGAAVLEQAQWDAGLREAPGSPAALLEHDPELGSVPMMEGTLLQYLDGKWRMRHLQVTQSFAVESRDSREVFEGGWECRRDLILTGCQICTTIQEHRLLVEDTCKHISGKRGGKMPFWDCPTEFPVFIHHRYCAPLCLCAETREAQWLWARLLRRAVQQQSTVLQRKDTFELRVFLEALRFLRQERGSYEPGVLVMGSEEEVLSSLVMEEILPCLRYQIFPRLFLDQRRLTWIKLQAEVYDQVCAQVRTELKVLMKELTQQRPLLEKLVRSELHQITALQDLIAHKITEDRCGEISYFLSHAIIPLLVPTFQAVATPICDGFAAARQHFLDTCDEVIAKGCSGETVHEILSPLCDLGLGSARASQYLPLLELSAGGQAWLQASWGIHRDFCRLLVYQAQSTLQQLLDRAAVMFRRLLAVQIRFFLDPSQLSAALHRVRDQVLKQLDQDLRSIRTRLVLESVLQLSLPALIQKLSSLEPSLPQPLGYRDHTPFLHSNILHHQVLRASLTREIHKVIRDTLPQDCVPLSAELQFPSSEHVYEDLSPPCGWLRTCSQLSDSPTLTPGSFESVEGSEGDGGTDGVTVLEGGEFISVPAAKGRQERERTRNPC
ncbi:hypothetical protein JZ751_016607 [Albula glossodonta]|uniref:Niban 1/2/3 domain-containing protein n=1 Tax=Albula glossodonta TaxID=121402 RepID=A0A8T2MRU8_9TELE|nr:hypothetical protein JZ751_016607 [Albula glossodonta]